MKNFKVYRKNENGKMVSRRVQAESLEKALAMVPGAEFGFEIFFVNSFGRWVTVPEN